MHLKPLLLAAALSMSLTNVAPANPASWQYEWPNTNFENTSVANWSEIMSGGPPKDGIPSLSDPSFIRASQESKIEDREPVITVEIGGQEPRAYPIRYLTWHEIVNDKIGNVPVAVTFCPLCNSGITFDRRVRGKLLSFGVSGKLRNSDMVMFDRETESWWQQAIGTGTVGEGARYPQLRLLLENSSLSNERNPYVNYDSSRRPFLYSGEMPPHGVPALARVVRVGERAWPVSRLSNVGEVSEAGLTISWNSGQASALDSQSIAQGKDVGTIRVRKNGKDVPHDVMFAFAFHAFFPDGTWMLN